MGTVKWFNAMKGYGFIKPDAARPDVFVHISAVERAGYTSLVDGAKISYEVVTIWLSLAFGSCAVLTASLATFLT